MKAQGISSTPSLTSTLDFGGWSASRTSRFTPGKRPDTNCTGSWVGPRDGLDGYRKFPVHLDLILGPSRPWQVATPTTSSRLTFAQSD